MSNKRRLKKGVTSLDKQIQLHEEKMKKAVLDGEIELGDYYIREIEALKNAKKKKEKMLKRKE